MASVRWKAIAAEAELDCTAGADEVDLATLSGGAGTTPRSVIFSITNRGTAAAGIRNTATADGKWAIPIAPGESYETKAIYAPMTAGTYVLAGLTGAILDILAEVEVV